MPLHAQLTLTSPPQGASSDALTGRASTATSQPRVALMLGSGSTEHLGSSTDGLAELPLYGAVNGASTGTDNGECPSSVAQGRERRRPATISGATSGSRLLEARLTVQRQHQLRRLGQQLSPQGDLPHSAHDLSQLGASDAGAVSSASTPTGSPHARRSSRRFSLSRRNGSFLGAPFEELFYLAEEATGGGEQQQGAEEGVEEGGEEGDENDVFETASATDDLSQVSVV